MGAAVSLVAFVATYLLGRKSLVKGILSAITFGYAFGILRANFPQTASYFIFDAAVVGLYCAQFKQITGSFFTPTGQHLKNWVTLLILWPLLLFFVPQQDSLVQLVGLRGNMFLLPFVLLGARLDEEQVNEIGFWLAILNISAFAIGTAEYIFGVEHFFPQNEVTYLIFRSNDVGASNAYRIPSVFANAHSFGGMMAISLPWVAGAWVQLRQLRWKRNVLLGGVVSAMIGVFMSAARVDFVALIVLITVFTFSTRLRPVYRVAWLVVLIGIGYLVANNERMQRFTTLGNSNVVALRVESSINVNLLQAIERYPFGVGLGGGGTSMPYFLEGRVSRPVAIESELGRIQLETGLVGLSAWLGFVLWVLTRPRPHSDDPWFLGFRLAWFCNLTFLIIGLVGIGLMTAIPSSAVLLMSIGWMATYQSRKNAGLAAIHRGPFAARAEPRLGLALHQPGATRR